MRQRPHMRNRRKSFNGYDVAGLGLLTLTTAGFIGMFAMAYQIDASNGITFAESMCNNGFSGFCAAVETPLPESGFHSNRDYCSPADCREYIAAKRLIRFEAAEVRLIGKCGNRYYAATEESSFPAGCAWIEPIKEESH